MTYNKETRKELMQNEIKEDTIKEETRKKIHSEKEKIRMKNINHVKMNSWIHTHHSDLLNEFIEEDIEVFEEYCKNRWREVHD